MSKYNLVSLKPLFSFMGLSVMPSSRMRQIEIQRENMAYALKIYNERRPDLFSNTATDCACGQQK
jgi:hypothetical protein